MRKIRAAAQVNAVAHTTTPTNPGQGCHQGTPPGVACRNNITAGVNGGRNRRLAVVRTPFGLLDQRRNQVIGAMIGRI